MTTTSNDRVTPFTGDDDRGNTNSSETETTLPDSNRPSTSTLVPSSSSSPSPSPSPTPYKSLPLSFNIYYKQWFSSTYQIGEHESQPLFTIQRHGAWGKGGDKFKSNPNPKAMIILHQGADASGPIVGTVSKDREGGVLSHDTIIELPLAKGPNGGACIRERLESDVSLSLKNSRFRFSFDIPVTVETEGKESTTYTTRRETFEWRISKAIEVRSLDSTAFGWKLVRLGVNHGSDNLIAAKGGPRGIREEGETSDGKEVVAAWSENSGMTLSKIAKFHFLGRGATGEFGDDWALVVALSAFRLWKFTSGSISLRP